MNYKRVILFGVIIFLFATTIWYGYRDVKSVIQYFPINKEIAFTDVGSTLKLFKKDKEYIIQADSWSKTSEKVYLRQDVNLLFQNGFLIQLSYPWKENTDWIVNKIQEPVEKDSVYTLLSYHHAEIHQDNGISMNQSVTADKLYVVYFQDTWEAFNEPQNARQKEAMEILNQAYINKRKKLFEKAIKDLNVNQMNYEVYNLDTFSLKEKPSKVITEEQWERILGGLWEGIYRSYLVGITKDELTYFSSPMPWVLIDRNGTHVLVIFQQYNGQFAKLIMEI